MASYTKLRRVTRGEATELWYGRGNAGPVALKVLSSSSAEAEEHFFQEARLLSRLRHPAIVRLVDTGRDEDGAPFTVLEWIDGAEWGSLPRGGEGHRSIAAAIAGALEEIHREGVVHRDVTPSNVLVAFDGRSFLVDFGIAHLPGGTITRAPVTRGTPGFMSPEQIDGLALDGRADVFSLACSLVTTFTGTSAWEGNDAEAITRSVRERSPVIGPAIDAELASWLRRCLSKSPAARPDAASFGAFLCTRDAGLASVVALFSAAS